MKMGAASKWKWFEEQMYVRGVLGNKCAGQHNLTTVHFRETLASEFFGMVISNTCVFFQRSIYPRTAAASFYVTMVRVTPYKPFLKVPWVPKQLDSSDFLFRRSLKAAGVKYAKNGAGRTSWSLFPQPFFENRGGDGFLGAGPAKKKFWTDTLGLLRPKTAINLC